MHATMQPMAKIKHIAIASSNPDKTAEFYKRVFDLTEVGRVDNSNAVGCYFSDGSVNLAILYFRDPIMAGPEFGADYSGIHHIGFQVDDAAETESKLRENNSEPRSDINAVTRSSTGMSHDGRNVETKYSGPDGIMLDIWQAGWVGTEES